MNRKFFSFSFIVFLLGVLFIPLSVVKVSATEYTPSIFGSYAVTNPSDCLTEDGSYGSIAGENGYIIFDLGSSYGNITEIDLKEMPNGSSSRMDMYVSSDNVDYYLVANNVYHSSVVLTWKNYSIPVNRADVRYVKICSVGSQYWFVDDIHFVDLPKNIEYADMFYPQNIIEYSTSPAVYDSMAVVCGFYDGALYDYHYLGLYYTDSYISYDFGTDIIVDCFFINMSRASGTGNVEVYLSDDSVVWNYIGEKYADGVISVDDTVSSRYVRLLCDSSSTLRVDNIAVNGTEVSDSSSGVFTSGNMVFGMFGVGVSMFFVPLFLLAKRRETISGVTAVEYCFISMVGFCLIVGAV